MEEKKLFQKKKNEKNKSLNENNNSEYFNTHF